MKPTPGIFLTTEWRHLVMLNYEIDPALLRPHVPRGTELEEWQGKTMVSIVGLLFLNTRVLGVPIPLHRNFPEINLRFYVQRDADGERRRGVVFLKEIVPRWAIATVARVVYNENYAAHRMRYQVEPGALINYEWCDQQWHSVQARPSGAPQALRRGSEEEFITEHYWGYVRQRDGGTVEYQVEHPPWRVWRADEVGFKCNVARVYGREFVAPLSARPSSAFVAEGSPISVRRGVRL